MQKIRYVLLIITMLVVVFSSCSDKSKEEAQTPPPPPIDTLAIIDTTSEPVVPVDTLPAEPELPGMPSAPQGDGFAIQVASCTDEAYARYLVDLWTNRGYEPFVTNFSYEGDSFYRVRLGLFMTHAEAKSMTAELLDKYSLKTWIDQVSY